MRTLAEQSRQGRCLMAVGMVWTVVATMCLGCGAGPEKEAFQVGALLPLTGPAAIYGQYARQGLEVAVEEINKGGGVRGQRLAIAYEDSQSNAASGVSAYRKLLTVNRVPVTLTEFSPVVMACAPIANERRSVLLNCGAQTPLIRRGGPFVFSAIPDANQEAREMAAFAYRKLGLRRLATFCINTDTGVHTTQIFSQAFQELGGKIMAQEMHEQGASDFRAQLTKLKGLAPPAVYNVSIARDSALILRQAAEIGLRTQWLSYTSFQGEDILRVAREAAEGTIYTYPRFHPEASERAKAFAVTYSSKYGSVPEVYAATFYDGLFAIKMAAEAEGVSGESIRNGLRKIVYQGIAGPIDFRHANWVEKPLEFRIVRNGSFEVYAESGGDAQLGGSATAGLAESLLSENLFLRHHGQ